MLNENCYELGSRRSVIREIFEYAKLRSTEIGEDNVFDFSIGNPSIPAPHQVNETIKKLIEETPSVALHGYTSAQGDKVVRDKISKSLKTRFGVDIPSDNLYMTCGAAASLTITLNALCNEGDEVIVFAPYFTEYKVFIEGARAKLVVVPCDENTLFPDFTAFEKSITARTKAVLINSPNNPSGVVYSEEVLRSIANVMNTAKNKFGHTVYLISDEPYRELVYDKEVKVPFVTECYPHSIVCYSYSKSLCLAGERVGYIAVNPMAEGAERVYAAICGAGRRLGFVCAPSLFQRVVAECDGLTGDLNIYKRNRDLLYESLTSYGFSCIYPSGAFYLFMKTPEASARDFCERAKKYELLLVPSDDFCCSGFVRIAYCVETEKIERALPFFKALAKEYGL